jgi:hypothetical protein
VSLIHYHFSPLLQLWLTPCAVHVHSRLAGEIVPKFSELKQSDRAKTFRFGEGDDDSSQAISIDVRQLRYTEVGLAWKVWDSGLLLSSFIYRHRDAFRGKSVLELGRYTMLHVHPL